MQLAAEALDEGVSPEFRGRPLAGALRSLATRSIGDAKAAMYVAADELGNRKLLEASV
jgi:hypothetical protein